jgi:hypothetical protein
MGSSVDFSRAWLAKALVLGLMSTLLTPAVAFAGHNEGSCLQFAPDSASKQRMNATQKTVYALNSHGVSGRIHVARSAPQRYWVRSIYLRLDNMNMLETGWQWGPLGNDPEPRVFAARRFRGVYTDADSGPLPGFRQLDRNSDHTFTILKEGPSNPNNFKMFVDGDIIQNRAHSALAVNRGFVHTGAESWNVCDGIWSHFWNLFRRKDHDAAWVPWEGTRTEAHEWDEWYWLDPGISSQDGNEFWIRHCTTYNCPDYTGKATGFYDTGGSVLASDACGDEYCGQVSPPPPSWSDWEPHGGSIKGGLDAAAYGYQQLTVAGRNEKNEVVFKNWSSSGGWGPWYNLTWMYPYYPTQPPIDPIGAATSDPSVANTGNGDLEFFYRKSPDDRVASNVWHSQGGTWGPTVLLGSPTAVPAVGNAPDSPSAPDAASSAAGSVHVFLRGADNALWLKYRTGSTWSDWVSLGGSLTSAPSAVSISPNTLHVFGRGTDQALWMKYWNGSQWSEWTSLGGSLTSGPDATSWGANRLAVFARGTDNSLMWKRWDGATWSGWELLGGDLSADDPAAASWGGNRLDVFVRWADGTMRHRWYA